MSMGMGMVMRQRLVHTCNTCKRPTDDHDPNCPTRSIEELLDKELRWRCARACSGTVRATIDDFLMCGTCGCRYSVGLADTENPERVHLLRTNPSEDFVPAVVLTKPPGRKISFSTDVVLARLRVQVREWRAARRKPRRKHSRSSAVRCELCGPVCCKKAD